MKSSLCIVAFLIVSLTMAWSQKKTPKMLFKDYGLSSVIVHDDGEYKWLKKKEIKYETPILSIKNKGVSAVVKIIKVVQYGFDVDFEKADITADFYLNFSQKNKIRYIEKANELEFVGNNQLLFIRNGLAGSDDNLILYYFPEKKPFLTAKSEYYQIEIPQIRANYYCGFTWIDTERPKLEPLLFAELHFSTNETPEINVKIFAKNKPVLEQMDYPNIEFIRRDSTDKIKEDKHRKLLTLRNFFYETADDIGFKLFFIHTQTLERKEYKFLIQKGELILPKEIIVEFDK